MLARKKFAREVEGFVCDLIVSVANTAMGLYRSSLVEEGLRMEEPNPMVHSFLWLQWPVIKAGTVDGHLAWLEYSKPEEDQGEAAEGESTEPELVWHRTSIQDLTHDQFLENVPEQVASDWIQMILELNPHWVYRSTLEVKEELDDPAKKKNG